ncbi:Hemerythrin HHE cation binding domain [Ceratobasidium sp. AG-Ba]|nr:Hemerythrin HHE cation binding domain [Ceratobasidium sp. AG-Ba]
MNPKAPIPVLDCVSADLETMDYLDAYIYDTSMMHNALIRGFNSVVTQAAKIQPCEISAFATYVAAFCETLRRHCEGENEIIFPRLVTHVALDGSDNVAVLQKLERVEEWVREAVETPQKTDPMELKTAMEILAPAFASNMHDQVKQMSPTLLRPFTSCPELRALVDDDIMWIGQNSHMEYLLPFLFLHHDRTANAFWPGLPAEAKAAVPALVGMHSESWSYAPFSVNDIL